MPLFFKLFINNWVNFFKLISFSLQRQYITVGLLDEMRYCSYKKIAAMAGNPKVRRALGMANNRNLIVIIIPCHRVIGADGSLTGYRGGRTAIPKSGILE